MDKFNCIGCGASLNPDKIRHGYITCEYCGNVYKLTKRTPQKYIGNRGDDGRNKYFSLPQENDYWTIKENATWIYARVSWDGGSS